MSVYKIENIKCIEKIFDSWDETLIWSCLQGCMGQAYADSLDNPKSAQIVIADFCFFAGEPNRELVEHKPTYFTSDFIIMTAREEAWNHMIEDVYKERSKKVIRYAIKKESDIFDRTKLTKIVNELSAPYSLKMIDEESYHSILTNKWTTDLCSQFASYEDYKKRGLGVVAIKDGEILAGASSYTVYRDGIEIEIDTRIDYRRKGLAYVCGAKLILACLERNLYPSWDAQNWGSVQLAEKLGYHFDTEYIAYEIVGY